ncbi:MAG: peptidoglycan -binding protein [Acetobacteraceae bacterium]|nr:peptidoglycan -binding protein [Acetobacteraceae bacterium]
MAMPLRRRGGNGLEAWPGYVDALSTLLMVTIFVLLVFVLAQAFLSVALSGRDRALDRVNRQLAELSDMLSLERGRSAELSNSVASLTRDLRTATEARDSLAHQLAAVQSQLAQASNDRDAVKNERDRIAAQLADANLQTQSANARVAQLQSQVADAAKHNDTSDTEAARVAGQLADARRQLADMQKQLDESNRTVKADKATIEARLSDLAKLAEQTRALTALRDELEKQAQDSAVRATTEQQRREAVQAQLAQEKNLGDSARAQIALLNRQVDELKAQMAAVARALDLAEAAGRDKDTQIANLGQRLNVALAAKVEELQRYRSEFFGKLRDVLAGRPGIQIVGDRFVFQSEVLFPVGSADITPSGQDQIRAIAHTIRDIGKQIPPKLGWVLRVDGHADRQPITSGAFQSNWELSTQRAVNVVKLLIQEGVPADHLAAAGFGDHQPLDPANTPEAFAKNRRIELRLTDR